MPPRPSSAVRMYGPNRCPAGSLARSDFVIISTPSPRPAAAQELLISAGQGREPQRVPRSARRAPARAQAARPDQRRGAQGLPPPAPPPPPPRLTGDGDPTP